jgi:uncharacterized LabA/DUF88 family protein
VRDEDATTSHTKEIMSKDVWERARQFVEDGDREDAEQETILAPYERITIRGTVLIDGHHVLLGTLGDVDNFNRHLREHPRFLGGIENKWLDPHPVALADVVSMSVIGPLEQLLPLKVAEQFTGTTKTCVDRRSIIEGCHEGPDQYCAVDSQTDVLVFDARMPPASKLIAKLERKRKHYSHEKVVRLDIERRLKSIRSGHWEFSSKVLPYSFKNAFLDALTHSWYGWKEHLGERKFDISDRGRFDQTEKGVDARLVIAGCKAAGDPKVDWVCLVTNDSDYVPLVEHLRSRGKVVYLLSLDDPRRQSRDLKDAVGIQSVIDKVDLYNFFPKEPIPELFRSKPALITLLTHCALTQLGSQVGGIFEETFDSLKHMEFLKRYDDLLP